MYPCMSSRSSPISAMAARPPAGALCGGGKPGGAERCCSWKDAIHQLSTWTSTAGAHEAICSSGKTVDVSLTDATKRKR